MAAAVQDTVSCGSGNDFIEADLKDTFSSCEQRDIAPWRDAECDPSKPVAARLPRGNGACAPALSRGVGSLGCKGRLRLDRSRRVRYSIRAGRRKTVALELGERAVRRLRGRRRSGVLTSVERGRIGTKTTIRTLRLRLR